jgi:hypothetical protein
MSPMAPPEFLMSPMAAKPAAGVLDVANGG